MNETMWKEDVEALHAAAGRRASRAASGYAVMSGRSLDGMQMGIP
jgi:hypothetical protein